ncbi:hypothetical protein ABK040_008258 [Willaertia magna]
MFREGRRLERTMSQTDNKYKQHTFKKDIKEGKKGELEELNLELTYQQKKKLKYQKWKNKFSNPLGYVSSTKQSNNGVIYGRKNSTIHVEKHVNFKDFATEYLPETILNTVSLNGKGKQFSSTFSDPISQKTLYPSYSILRQEFLNSLSPQKQWDPSFVLDRIKPYDAVKDEHCLFTKTSQFKKQFLDLNSPNDFSQSPKKHKRPHSAPSKKISASFMNQSNPVEYENKSNYYKPSQTIFKTTYQYKQYYDWKNFDLRILDAECFKIFDSITFDNAKKAVQGMWQCLMIPASYQLEFEEKHFFIENPRNRTKVAEEISTLLTLRKELKIILHSLSTVDVEQTMHYCKHTIKNLQEILRVYGMQQFLYKERDLFVIQR